MTTTTATQPRNSAASTEKTGTPSGNGNTNGTPATSNTPRRAANAARPQRTALPGIFAAPPGVLMNAFLRNPWTFIRYMQDEMDRDFPTTTSADADQATHSNTQQLATIDSKSTWAPAMEVFRRGGDLVVHAELPGLRTDDIDVSIQDNALVISGERKQQHENAAEGVYRSERRYGFFQRAVPLPEGVNEEHISASFSDGVLEVRVPLPAPEVKASRKIKIS